MGILALSGKLTLRGLRRILLFVCLTALLCIAAGLLGNSLLYGEKVVEPVRVALVDEDDTFESRMLTRYLTELEDYEELIAFVQTDRAEGDSLWQAGALDAILLLPDGFIKSVLDGRNMPVVLTLRGDSPLRASLIRVFAGVYADMLRTGQIGVYACLSAAREEGSEAYEQMFRDANLRFLTTMVNSRAMLDKQELSATGAVGTATHYAASTLVFVMLLGGVLFLDIWHRGCARPVLLRLRAFGHPPVKTGGYYLAGATLPFLLSGIIFTAGAALLMRGQVVFSGGMLLLLPTILLLACLSAALMIAVLSLVGGGASGCVFLFLLNLFCLFVSGGILPSAYLSPLLRAIGNMTPHLRFTRLLLDSLAGQADPLVWGVCLAWTAVFCGLALLGLWRRGKVGAKL